MSKRLIRVKKHIVAFLSTLAMDKCAFRGTLYDFHQYFDWFDYADVASAVMELINENKILYIKDEEIYTLILKEEDMEAM